MLFVVRVHVNTRAQRKYVIAREFEPDRIILHLHVKSLEFDLDVLTRKFARDWRGTDKYKLQFRTNTPPGDWQWRIRNALRSDIDIGDAVQRLLAHRARYGNAPRAALDGKALIKFTNWCSQVLGRTVSSSHAQILAKQCYAQMQ